MTKNEQFMQDVTVGKIRGDRTRKKAYMIWAKKARPGMSLYNHLEDSFYVISEEKNVVLSGTDAEQWPVGASVVNERYEAASGGEVRWNEESSVDNGWTKLRVKVQDHDTHMVFRIPEEVQNLKVQTCWGDTLTGNIPDESGRVPEGGRSYLAAELTDGKPDFQKLSIINEIVLARTYETESFSEENRIPQPVYEKAVKTNAVENGAPEDFRTGR